MSEEMQGQVRHILTSVGGVLVGLGYVSSSWIEPAVGVAMAVVGFVWSYIAKKPAA
ncbi:hypothetical protein UFOVP470_19 [uncultured Caudovirales phage]|uniref:Uncharacterized protein n=1 Tax=uncultured Caudovirales phage TaxID=2100421 RepID=A0A6J5MAT3_9CAUD|nr:hypothetical protein UFOVP470_19 [uncultured Caudovirales phage]